MHTDFEQASAPAGNTAPDETHPSTPEAAQESSQSADSVPQDDPIFLQEQRHLCKTYATLQAMRAPIIAQMEQNRKDAAADKQSMVEEIAPNFASYGEAQETYVDYATVNRVIEGYNLAEESLARKLDTIDILLRQPYFAKVALQFKPEEPVKELYIGNAGISDDSYRRLIVDWRSPVAEVYYNQENGPTSYRANGRTINVDLKVRRQFDIVADRLNAYFDTSVAIQDSLLLASLSKHRTARMQAITATIQKEQNQVIRHEDVPVLLVSGIAGSGKTSVLLQRIAYLFYQHRGDLDPSEVFLVTPNSVFRHYINNVLPDLGERNPELQTWDEFASTLMPPDRSHGNPDVPMETLRRIDEAIASFTFDQDDFKDVRIGDTRLVSVAQIRQIAAKFSKIPAGPHLIALMREEIAKRVDNRLGQIAGTESIADEIAALSIEEQLRIFHETVDPQDEKEERAFAQRYVNAKYGEALTAVERDEWLRIDRIGMRLLGVQNLEPVVWLYLKIALTGLGNPSAKYVMVDEVQDYTAAQLAVLARYFRRANFLLLGDQNQAIKPGTASFDEIRAVFQTLRGSVSECRLMTSYRSSPEITDLFASLLDKDEQMRISSIQRAHVAPNIVACPDDERYDQLLRQAIEEASKDEGLTAVIFPWKDQARRLHKQLGEDAPPLVDRSGALPERGVVLISLQLAKGLEFDQVIIPDASATTFPDDPLSRRRLYTTISRATRKITVLSRGTMTPMLRRSTARERR